LAVALAAAFAAVFGAAFAAAFGAAFVAAFGAAFAAAFGTAFATGCMANRSVAEDGDHWTKILDESLAPVGR